MLLMISVKNACRNGWFEVTDADELLALANEISSTFCGAENITVEPTDAQHIISKVMPRFYPQMKMDHIIVSLKAQPGYDILVADFHISKSMPPTRQERIRLFVVQTDNMETSSCITSPPQVNFLLNGKGVERRTNVSMDSGPQFPTDVTTMLRYGTNLIQAIGYFNGNYIIAIVYMSSVPSPDPMVLQDYIQPAAADLASVDAEIIEGPSRISVNCPISYKRINTPVKGHLCRHHQCFDYDNYMEINSRKPSWRCPHCNQPVSCTDLRIDRNMVKVLREVGADVADVLISADGSWEVVAEYDGHPDQLPDRSLTGQQDGLEHCEPKRFQNIVANVVDLTMEETDGINVVRSSTATEALMGYGNESFTNSCDTEDRKPFQDALEGLPVTENLSESAVVNSTLETVQEASFQTVHDFWSRILSSVSASNGSVVSTTGMDEYLSMESMLAPVLTDAVSPALNRVPMDGCSLTQSATVSQNVPQVGQIVATENLQLQQPRFGNSIVIGETERPSISRHVSRVPVAIQALPAQTQVPNLHHLRARANVLSANPMIANGNPPNVPQSSPSVAANQDGFNVNQDVEDVHYVPNQSFQVGARTSSEQQRTGSYGASIGVSPGHQNTHHQRSAHLRVPQTISQPANVVQQFSRFPSMHVQPSAQGVVGLAAAGTTDHHTRLMIPHHPSQMARPTGVTSQLQTARSASSYTAPDGFRLSFGEHRRNLGSGTQSIPIAESFPEMPSEQNWRPTGRMRGSLAGRAYSAALSQFMVQPTNPVQARAPITTMAAISSEQLQVHISNSIHANGQSQAYSTVGPADRSGSSSILPEQSSML
ncbi:E4 SUMO-protein ligase PIAL1-like isoform X2 [Magnolia sinica]|nr:E4 SUMO-protein ligase PIAL1-like isoform X2 [Magnolia sinica]